MLRFVGLGYVGLPLAVAFAQKGFRLWGLDVSVSVLRVLRIVKAISST